MSLRRDTYGKFKTEQDKRANQSAWSHFFQASMAGVVSGFLFHKYGYKQVIDRFLKDAQLIRNERIGLRNDYSNAIGIRRNAIANAREQFYDVEYQKKKEKLIEKVRTYIKELESLGFTKDSIRSGIKKFRKEQSSVSVLYTDKQRILSNLYDEINAIESYISDLYQKTKDRRVMEILPQTGRFLSNIIPQEQYDVLMKPKIVNLTEGGGLAPNIEVMNSIINSMAEKSKNSIVGLNEVESMVRKYDDTYYKRLETKLEMGLTSAGITDANTRNIVRRTVRRLIKEAAQSISSISDRDPLEKFDLNILTVDRNPFLSLTLGINGRETELNIPILIRGQLYSRGGYPYSNASFVKLDGTRTSVFENMMNDFVGFFSGVYKDLAAGAAKSPSAISSDFYRRVVTANLQYGIGQYINSVNQNGLPVVPTTQVTEQSFMRVIYNMAKKRRRSYSRLLVNAINGITSTGKKARYSIAIDTEYYNRSLIKGTMAASETGENLLYQIGVVVYDNKTHQEVKGLSRNFIVDISHKVNKDNFKAFLKNVTGFDDNEIENIWNDIRSGKSSRQVSEALNKYISFLRRKLNDDINVIGKNFNLADVSTILDNLPGLSKETKDLLTGKTHKVFDIEPMARILFGVRVGVKMRNLLDIISERDVNFKKRVNVILSSVGQHDALIDSRLTAEIYNYLMEMSKDLPEYNKELLLKFGDILRDLSEGRTISPEKKYELNELEMKMHLESVLGSAGKFSKGKWLPQLKNMYNIFPLQVPNTSKQLYQLFSSMRMAKSQGYQFRNYFWKKLGLINELGKELSDESDLGIGILTKTLKEFEERKPGFILRLPVFASWNATLSAEGINFVPSEIMKMLKGVVFLNKSIDIAPNSMPRFVKKYLEYENLAQALVDKIGLGKNEITKGINDAIDLIPWFDMAGTLVNYARFKAMSKKGLEMTQYERDMLRKGEILMDKIKESSSSLHGSESDVIRYVGNLLRRFGQVPKERFGNLATSTEAYRDYLIKLVNLLKVQFNHKMDTNGLYDIYSDYGDLNLNVDEITKYIGAKAIPGDKYKVWRIVRGGNGKISVTFRVIKSIEKMTGIKGQLIERKDIDRVITALKSGKNGTLGEDIQSIIENTEIKLLESGRKEDAKMFMKEVTSLFNKVHEKVVLSYGTKFPSLKDMGEGFKPYVLENKGLKIVENLTFYKNEYSGLSERAVYFDKFYQILNELGGTGQLEYGKEFENIVSKYLNLYDKGHLKKAKRFIFQEANNISNKHFSDIKEAIQFLKHNYKNENVLKMLNPYFKYFLGESDEEMLKHNARLFEFMTTEDGKEVLIGRNMVQSVGLSDLGITKNAIFGINVPYNVSLYSQYDRSYQWLSDLINAFMDPHKLEVLEDMSKGFKLNSKTIQEMAKNGEASIIGLQEIADVIGDYKNLLKGRLHISSDIMRKVDSGEMTLDEAIAFALDNPGENFTTIPKEGFEQVDRLIVNKTAYAKIYNRMRELLKGRPKNIFIDLGRDFNLSKDLLKEHGYSSGTVKAIQRELENGTLRYLYFPKGLVDNKDIFTAIFGKEDKVVPTEPVSNFFKTVSTLLEYQENSVITNHGTDMNRHLVRPILKYLDALGHTFSGKPMFRPKVPGFMAPALPSILLNRGKTLTTNEFDMFSVYLHPSDISKYADYLLKGGYTRDEVDKIIRGKFATSGVAVRYPIIAQGDMPNIFMQSSNLAKPGRLYVDPLTMIITQRGDYDGDLAAAIMNLSKSKSVKDVFNSVKVLYGVSDEDLNMWNLYGRISNGAASPKAYSDLAEMLGIEIPDLSTDTAKKEFLKKVKQMIDQKSDKISEKIKTHLQNILTVDEYNSLGIQNIKIKTNNMVNFITKEGNAYIPRMSVVTEKFNILSMLGKEKEKYLERLEKIGNVTGEELNTILKRTESVFFGSRTGEVIRNVFGKTMTGSAHNVLLTSGNLLSSINSSLHRGLSNDEIKSMLNIDISDDLINMVKESPKEKLFKVSRMIASIYDKGLKGKRGSGASLVSEAYETAFAISRGTDVHKLLNANSEIGEMFKDIGIAEVGKDGIYRLTDYGKLAMHALGKAYKAHFNDNFRSAMASSTTGLGSFLKFFSLNPNVAPEGISDVLNSVIPKRNILASEAAESILNKKTILEEGFNYLSKHVDNRLVKGMGVLAAVGIGGFMFTPKPFHGDLFSLGFNIGHVTGIDPSMYDGRWVAPELPREIPISADTTNFNKKTYMIKRMMDVDPNIYIKLRRSGALSSYDLFDPGYSNHRKRAYDTLKYRI